MPALEANIFIQFRVVIRAMIADKISLGAGVGKTAANYLLYLALMKINTGAKGGQGSYSQKM